MSKSRWFRYSLRTGLLVVTCLAIAFAWFGHYANQRKAAFSAIRQAGGDIRMGIREPSLLEEWFGAELFGSVEEVNLRKGQADNALLAQIGALKEVRRLDLSNADIDDEGLHKIVHLPLLELWLQETKITDASAATLSQIKSLTFLQLNATSLSDAFLEHLQPLPKLKTRKGDILLSWRFKATGNRVCFQGLEARLEAPGNTGAPCGRRHRFHWGPKLPATHVRPAGGACGGGPRCPDLSGFR